VFKFAPNCKNRIFLRKYGIGFVVKTKEWPENARILAFVRQLAAGWVLPPAGSGSILCTLLFLRWVHPSSSTWYWLFGEICGSICGRQREIRGIIYSLAVIDYQ
jgi:hypothetical protein